MTAGQREQEAAKQGNCTSSNRRERGATKAAPVEKKSWGLAVPTEALKEAVFEFMLKNDMTPSDGRDAVYDAFLKEHWDNFVNPGPFTAAFKAATRRFAEEVAKPAGEVAN